MYPISHYVLWLLTWWMHWLDAVYRHLIELIWWSVYRHLVQQLKKLQALVLSKACKPQASTCLVVLVMSFAFLIAPNIDPFGIKQDKLSDPKSIPIPGKRKESLLWSHFLWFKSITKGCYTLYWRFIIIAWVTILLMYLC